MGHGTQVFAQAASERRCKRDPAKTRTALMGSDNLFQPVAAAVPAEVFDELLCGGPFRLERIVSTGQATPEGQWYDQETAEWVVLLSGSAAIFIDGEAAPRVLEPGDFVNLPAHCRHRVEWTDRRVPTVWLALHYRPVQPPA
jgi:cupin 2 domain-containing protein